MDALISRWAAGDRAAAEDLYRSYHTRVREFIVSRGARLNDADDIAQEALIAGLEGLDAGRRPERLTAWLFGIARHKAAKLRPAAAAMPHDVLDTDRRGARSRVIRREMDSLLCRTLEGMSDNDREVVDLMHRAGLSRKEIAERLDLPVETVHARCDRAHGRLRAALSRHFTTVVAAGLAPRPVSLDAIRALRPAFRQAISARGQPGSAASSA